LAEFLLPDCAGRQARIVKWGNRQSLCRNSYPYHPENSLVSSAVVKKLYASDMGTYFNWPSNIGMHIIFRFALKPGICDKWFIPFRY
jgi:hypothetical protein